MKAKLKERLQCRGCKVPYCDALCTDLSDEQIDWIMELANKLVIEEFNKIPHIATPLGEEIRMSAYYVYKRINELKRK